MASAILNILEGVKKQAAERQAKEAAKQAEAGNVQNIDIRGGKQEAMTPEQMEKHIEMLASAVLQLTERFDGKGGNQ
ncbi:hypothetical protein GJU41_03010 [Bacillus idriensis]|uniref:Uncharacterized protein n=1 Tax=Metabacillus idriensis TaxID=324768 RepID=A0A6I2M927_9BACI|nr:hypothetical protein [Metabacillus idriensis]MRX52931.1 hypothetical protein [Metabacillus idriensis]